MIFDNEMTLTMLSSSKNESFARVAIAAFVAQLDPTVAEITDIKTAVSEAVTNAVIHGYENKRDRGMITLACKIADHLVYIDVADQGAGIDNIEQARTPLYTSKPELERSGIGFTVMEMFMDSMEVISSPGEGTTIRMTKKIAQTTENSGGGLC